MKNKPPTLPVHGDLSRAFVLSFLVALLLILASVAGLAAPSTLYPTQEARQSFLPNDVANLVIGLPILLLSMLLAHRGALVGLLLWPGSVLYTLYNYIVNLFGVPWGWITLVYLALVLSCSYLVFHLISLIDQDHLTGRLTNSVPRRLSAWILILFGIFFIYRAVDIILQAQGGLPMPEIGLLIADTVLSIAWIAGGILLLQRHPLGYASGLGLLFGPSMLFIGLVFLLLLRPFLIDVPFDLVELLVVVAMGVVCFIPFGLYLRAVASHPTSA